MKLTCYAMSGNPPRIVPAASERGWMDMTDQRYAYRCLPLAIANAHGWEILSPTTFSARWNGGPRREDVEIRPFDNLYPLEHFAVSHFANGIVTFHIGYIIRTEPGWNLLATGSFNRPKDGIAPLAGIIETDWLPFTFTMNWKFTRPGSVVFEKDEPICFIMPVQAGAIERFEPEIRGINDNPALAAEAKRWTEEREKFLKGLDSQDPETVRQKWQKHYFRGQTHEGTAIPEHKSKLHLDAPIDRRGQKEI